jgi:FkbM family methyltransferase
MKNSSIYKQEAFSFRRMGSKIEKLWNILAECFLCFRYGKDPRFFIPAILKKFAKWTSLLPFMDLIEKKSLNFLPASLKNMLPSLPNDYNVDDFYDASTSFFYFDDYIPRKGWSIIDAGAYQGFYTEICSKLVKEKGQVFSIEPNPSLCKALREKFMQSGYLNIKVIESALGNREGKIILYISNNFASVSSLEENHVHRFDAEYKSVEVNLSQIDTLVEEQRICQLDLVKIDVEGAELMALQGAKKSMSQQLIKRFIIEVHSDVVSPKDIKRFLSNYAYDTNIIINTSGYTRYYIYAKLRQ